MILRIKVGELVAVATPPDLTTALRAIEQTIIDKLPSGEIITISIVDK